MRAPPRGPRSLRCSGSGEVPWRRGVEDTRGQIQKANALDVIQDVPNRDHAMQEASCSEHQTFKQVEDTDANEQESLVEHVCDTADSYHRPISKLRSGDDVKCPRTTCKDDNRPYATSSSSQMPPHGIAEEVKRTYTHIMAMPEVVRGYAE